MRNSSLQRVYGIKPASKFYKVNKIQHYKRYNNSILSANNKSANRNTLSRTIKHHPEKSSSEISVDENTRSIFSEFDNLKATLLKEPDSKAVTEYNEIKDKNSISVELPDRVELAQKLIKIQTILKKMYNLNQSLKAKCDSDKSIVAVQYHCANDAISNEKSKENSLASDLSNAMKRRDMVMDKIKKAKDRLIELNNENSKYYSDYLQTRNAYISFLKEKVKVMCNEYPILKGKTKIIHTLMYLCSEEDKKLDRKIWTTKISKLCI